MSEPSKVGPGEVLDVAPANLDRMIFLLEEQLRANEHQQGDLRVEAGRVSGEIERLKIDRLRLRGLLARLAFKVNLLTASKIQLTHSGDVGREDREAVRACLGLQHMESVLIGRDVWLGLDDGQLWISGQGEDVEEAIASWGFQIEGLPDLVEDARMSVARSMARLERLLALARGRGQLPEKGEI